MKELPLGGKVFGLAKASDLLCTQPPHALGTQTCAQQLQGKVHHLLPCFKQHSDTPNN